MRRAFVIVIDACGAGEIPDSDTYGDAGANTLGHLAEAVGGLELPTLERLGLGAVLPLHGMPAPFAPVLHGRLRPLGPGKDSTAGHWELMGVIARDRLPVYPDGFPPEVVSIIEAAAGGRGILGNLPCNGIEAIERYGLEHEQTGKLIVYTSQDSVLQIAAHESVLASGELYYLARMVRERLPEPHRVGRVIARPFTGSAGAYRRTDGRCDFSITPPSRSYLQALDEASVPVHAVGKSGSLFCGIGVRTQHPGATNATALLATGALIDDLEHGLVFTNLIETDQIYGHRHDATGFHRALQEIDAHVGSWLGRLRRDDVLILTADHGCDVTALHTDHTREHAPLLVIGEGLEGRHDGVFSDVGASVYTWLTGQIHPDLPGHSFLAGAAEASGHA